MHLTILIAANQNGIEELLPVMIGHSTKPRFFQKLNIFHLFINQTENLG